MAPKLYLMQASAPCRTVLMVAKAIGLELELEEIEREQLRTPEMLELNPQHTVPILVDEDFILWDSHAISGYLVGQYAEDDALYPKDDVKKRAVIDQRMHFDNGTLFERMKSVFYPLLTGTGDITEDAKDTMVEAYGFLETFLDGNDWLCGDEMTIADLSIATTLATAELLIPIDPDRFPHLMVWLQKMKDLPYYDECNADGVEKFKEFIPSTD